MVLKAVISKEIPNINVHDNELKSFIRHKGSITNAPTPRKTITLASSICKENIL